MNKNSVKNIIILGGGSAGWMTAAALSNSLKNQFYNICLVESDQIGTIGVGEATVPTIMLFNNALGLNEDEFVRETNATFKLGIEFADWQKIGAKYFHPFGRYGLDMDGIGFTNFWLKWHQSGGKLNYTEFNVETLAAKSDKFMRIMNEDGPKVMPDVNYAYQFDAGLYAQFLRKFSERLGVKRIEGKVTRVEQNAETGFIQSLHLDNGQTIEGDLFVDCSGFKGLLIEETLKAGYSDWSHWLPTNSAVTVPSESVEAPMPYTRATAKAAGWQWKIPLQHRVGNGHVYCSEMLGDDEAVTTLMQGLDGKPLAEPKVIRYVTGLRKKCWVKNCVAIGLSSGFLEPLESTSIHLIQRAIFKLLAVFPRNRISQPLLDKFNQEMEDEYTEVKDFLIAHYIATEREDSEFWRYVKNMDIPDSLAAKLEIFKDRGEALVGVDGLFRDVNWFAILYGQGIVPKSYHPVADAVSDDELRLRLTKVRNAVQKRLEMMPNHGQYLKSSGLGR